ncbi:coniferyl alcohol acyltransferase-like [Phoenix dactylifera]|uniref:Coniferyl alcohol acyltransferase-like n=1 Tax=Phoenix dactylifera TaxID=42345 RepID=A0A8B7CJS4_PHODC|nr:coniferyl alcohol acyltransferase-like [Phoenix dactylifera]XP_038976936.1 coniferyl alcohol acyltransferase-like [Phoenix dactylifera]
MAAGQPPTSELSIRLISKSIVKAANSNAPLSVIPVSNFDHLSGRYPVTIFYAYRKPSTGDFNSVVNAIKTSLAETLNYFLPFAGRIVPNPETGEPEILCNNEGIELIEASADVSITSLNFHDLNDSVKRVMLPLPTEIPLSVQVTGFACGGFSMVWSFDHLLADGAGFIKFLHLWSELARTGRIPVTPNHDRSIFRPRSPPSYGPLLDRTFTGCKLHDVLAMPRNDISLKRAYYIHGSCIDRLQAAASKGGGVERTRTEAISAYLWKLLARSLGETDTGCKMGWLVDGRPWMRSEPDGDLSNYVGNLVSMAVGEASAGELKEGSLSYVAEMAAQVIEEVKNKAHFLELLDWIECRRPEMVLARILLGLKGPAVVVSSCHNMPVMATDFGFGSPRLGTFYTVLDAIGAGYVNLISSGREDGSSFVFAFIWPRLALELESDPEQVFLPVTADYIGL